MATVTSYEGCTVCCGGSPFDCTCTPPSVLYIDFTSVCPDFSGSAVPVTFNPSTQRWEAYRFEVPEVPAGFAFIAMYCDAGVWHFGSIFDFADCGSGDVVAESGGVCSPFSASFIGTIPADCCGPGGGMVTAHVVE